MEALDAAREAGLPIVGALESILREVAFHVLSKRDPLQAVPGVAQALIDAKEQWTPELAAEAGLLFVSGREV